jgi:hypothetical protein
MSGDINPVFRSEEPMKTHDFLPIVLGAVKGPVKNTDIKVLTGT